MRLTNYLSFADKKIIPPAAATPFYYSHANRDDMYKYRKLVNKIKKDIKE